MCSSMNASSRSRRSLQRSESSKSIRSSPYGRRPPDRIVERGPMIFRQITHDDLGCASYLVGDHSAGVAAVVDPKYEIDEYLELARYLGVSIEHILETHNHADHVSGHGRLRAATGATIHIHREAAPDYPHEPFEDGWTLELGGVRLRAIHT